MFRLKKRLVTKYSYCYIGDSAVAARGSRQTQKLDISANADRAAGLHEPQRKPCPGSLVNFDGFKELLKACSEIELQQKAQPLSGVLVATCGALVVNPPSVMR